MKISCIYKKNFFTNREEKKSFKKKTSSLINRIATEEEKKINNINIIFCSDKFIKKYNNKFLNHNYETDILTFYDIDDSGYIESELLISIDSVRNNAVRYKVSPDNELMRVIIHGMLHICGYNDKTKSEKIIIRKKENFYLK